jgi:hypothetical protein
MNSGGRDTLGTVRALLVLGAVLALADGAWAQPRPASSGSNPLSICQRREIVNENTYHCIGDVELTMDDTMLYADEAWYSPTRSARSPRNVLYIQGNNRISADRAEMDTRPGSACLQRLGPRQHPAAAGADDPGRRLHHAAACRSGYRRVILRRDDREDRPQK